MNANLVGLVAVLVWGAALPVAKIIITKIGVVAALGFTQFFCGVLGLLKEKYWIKVKIDKGIFRNPFLYGRWGFYVVNLVTVYAANALVSYEHISLVILLNYVWPTAIILFSVLFAGVKVTRPLPFALGLLVVLFSLSLEILKPGALSSAAFQNPADVLAYAVVFIGAIAWGLYSTLSKKAGEVTGGGSVVPFFQLTIGMALPLSFFPGMATWGNLDAPMAALLIGYSFLMFVAYFCWDYGMRKGNVVVLSLCADFMPWISLTAAAFLLGTPIGTKTALSAVLLVAGAMVARYGTLKKR